MVVPDAVGDPPGMWPALVRTRRHFLGGDAAVDATSPDPNPSTDRTTPGSAALPTAPIVLNLDRPAIDRLATALVALPGLGTIRPDTPGRLEEALATTVGRLGGAGRPQVTRRPAGLYTPEAWQVRLDAVDPIVAETIRHAAGGTEFERR
jgi:hypothetical protein